MTPPQLTGGGITSVPTISFLPVTIAGRPTSLKTRYRASGQQILRVDDEMTMAIDASAQQTLCKMAAHTGGVDMLVLSDYAKGCLPETAIRQLVDRAKPLKLTVADPKLADLSVYRDVDISRQIYMNYQKPSVPPDRYWPDWGGGFH